MTLAYIMMNNAPDILQKILVRKAMEVVERTAVLPLSALQTQVAKITEQPRGFAQALAAKRAQGKPGIIAEIKQASPSKGLLRADFQPAQIAAEYAAHGAACLSVLTDRDFFQGDDIYLQQARAACTLPVLRKDFMVDLYQIYEARLLGADCILLIAACLDDTQLLDMNALAQDLGMGVLLEVHDADELQRALQIPGCILGINNRNLRTFVTRLETTLDLLPNIPAERMVVTESGIQDVVDIQRMQAQGVQAFLIGEACMRAEHPGKKLEEFMQ